MGSTGKIKGDSRLAALLLAIYLVCSIIFSSISGLGSLAAIFILSWIVMAVMIIFIYLEKKDIWLVGTVALLVLIKLIGICIVFTFTDFMILIAYILVMLLCAFNFMPQFAGQARLTKYMWFLPVSFGVISIIGWFFLFRWIRYNGWILVLFFVAIVEVAALFFLGRWLFRQSSDVYRGVNGNARETAGASRQNAGYGRSASGADEYCTECGAPRRPGSAFCGKCGHKF